MPKDDLKKRIEALNRKPMKNTPDEESQEIKALRRKLQKNSGAGARHTQVSTPEPKIIQPQAPEQITYSRMVGTQEMQTDDSRNWGEPRVKLSDLPFVKLEEAIEGIITTAPMGPGYYRIEKNAEDLEAGSNLLYKRFMTLTGYPGNSPVERLQAICGEGQICPEDMVFLDLETCGLSMCSVFLVGTMECTKNTFVFKQYFARDYSEEASIVSAISERLSKAKLMITFNGKTFDAPFLRNRARATGVKLNEAKTHLDLFHESRRLYKNKLPNCKLQTLERMICGRCREDDIPGSEIPAAYHEYVRTKNAGKINLILLHNLYDLLTMADLMTHMWPQK